MKKTGFFCRAMAAALFALVLASVVGGAVRMRRDEPLQQQPLRRRFGTTLAPHLVSVSS